MNYGLIYELYNAVDMDKAVEMNDIDRKKYFKKIERKVKRKIKKYDSMFSDVSKFQVKQIQMLEDLKDDMNVDELIEIISEKSSDDAVSKNSVLFYSLFENVVRFGFECIFSTKFYLGVIVDLLHLLFDNYNFRSSFLNKEKNQELNIDVPNKLFQQYVKSLVASYFDFVYHRFHIGISAVEVASKVVDMVVDHNGLSDDFMMNIEMMSVCQHEIDNMLNIFDSLDADGFSVSKMLLNFESVKNDGVLNDYKNDVSFDLDHQELFCDDYELIEINDV